MESNTCGRITLGEKGLCEEILGANMSDHTYRLRHGKSYSNVASTALALRCGLQVSVATTNPERFKIDFLCATGVKLTLDQLPDSTDIYKASLSPK